MAKIISTILTFVLLLSVLSGCSSSNDEKTQSDESTNFSSESQSENSSHDLSMDESEDISESSEEENSSTDDNSSSDDFEKDEEQLFKYDKYMIKADAKDYISDREYELYCQMIDSILSYNGVVDGFESYDEFFKVWGFLLSEFVPVRSIVKSYLNSEEPFIYDNGRATLMFAYDKETCEQNYSTFENIMNEALSLIKKDDSAWERIAKLYMYVSNNITYGNPYFEYGVQSDLYNCIVYKLGQCGTYAFFLNMLANQIGFETIDGCSIGKNGFEGADHSWSMIRVEGKWYHFDACWQAPMISHEDMEYFAFSTQTRYDSLSSNNPMGIAGDLEMFDQDDYTHERTELPYCDSGMSYDEKHNLYLSVIDEYIEGASKDNVVSDKRI